MQQRGYSLPTEVRTEMRIWKFPITVIITMFLFLFLAQRTSNLVFTPFQFAWQIYNVLVGLFLATPSAVNRKKRNFASILLAVSKDDRTYKPIEKPIE